MTYSSARMLQLANSAFRGNFTSIRDALLDVRGVFGSISATTLGYLASVTAGTGAASKALVLDSSGHVLMPSGGLFKFSQAALAAAGSTSADAATLTAQFQIVTGADAAKGVALPAAADRLPYFIFNAGSSVLLVYPVNGGNDNINSIAEDLPYYLPPLTGQWFIAVSATQWWTQDSFNANPILTLSGAATLTAKQHGNRTLLLTGSGSSLARTLPDATGSGVRFTFVVGAVNTSNHVIVVPDASNVMKGVVNILDNDSNAQTAYAASGTDDTLTLNGTTTGGQIGDRVEFIDIATDTWAVSGNLLVPAGSNVADPFSATV